MPQPTDGAPVGAPPQGIPVVPETFAGDRALCFECKPGIACWNACCSSIDISLTPYDVLRLRERLGLGSAQFLREHTVPYEMEKDGMAGVKLRPVEGGSACRFMRPEGCAVYSDRPTACRYYPLALLSMRKQGESVDRDAYALVNEPHCLGHAAGRTLTVAEYRGEQGVETYDELARGWRQLVLKKKSSGPTVGTPSKRSRELFFMACYDLDRFREFVASDGFLALHDITQQELQQIVADDTALLAFAYRFLRQALFGEKTIALREEAARERMERFRAKSEERERRAAMAAGDAPDEGWEVP